MKRPAATILGAVLLAVTVAAGAAQDAPEAPREPPRTVLEVPPERLGYAFDQPQVLIRQRLFGLAHGLSLLAAACLDLPEHSTAIQDAYAGWHAGQAAAIETLVKDLARHYFGERAAEADWRDLARALGLHDSIHPSLGQVALADACASLPAAIGQPRYQLDRLLAEVDDAAAVRPAPTLTGAAQ